MAKELRLDWSTVKALEMQYMRAQLRHPPRKPAIIGIDELSVRKGHTYRIIVSDLVRERPIWFGGNDRSEVSMDLFFKELCEKKNRGIQHRAYGLRDEEYLRFKILTCMLPAI